jgi:hypothetical protein
MGLLPLVLFPFSRGLWLALDWTFRPPSTERRPDHPRPGPTPVDATPAASAGESAELSRR